MTRKEFFTLLKCAPRLLAATVSGNQVAFDNTSRDIEAVHAQIDARKGIVRH